MTEQKMRKAVNVLIDSVSEYIYLISFLQRLSKLQHFKYGIYIFKK